MGQPLWQLGHCLASKFSGVTRNMLLHWTQTRWITGAPGGMAACSGLCAVLGGAGADSLLMTGF